LICACFEKFTSIRFPNSVTPCAFPTPSQIPPPPRTPNNANQPRMPASPTPHRDHSHSQPLTHLQVVESQLCLKSVPHLDQSMVWLVVKNLDSHNVPIVRKQVEQLVRIDFLPTYTPTSMTLPTANAFPIPLPIPYRRHSPLMCPATPPTVPTPGSATHLWHQIRHQQCAPVVGACDTRRKHTTKRRRRRRRCPTHRNLHTTLVPHHSLIPACPSATTGHASPTNSQ
jgi:hypothetical protein